MRNIIFLDIDGVLNCEIHYRNATKPSPTASREEFRDHNISKERVQWLNKLCASTDTAVVISSSWRGDGLDEMRKLLGRNGATFPIIDITPYSQCRTRGVEIKMWLDSALSRYITEPANNFRRYAIIDDDSDMLLNQAENFFHTDGYSGLTPNTCYKIKRFFDSFIDKSTGIECDMPPAATDTKPLESYFEKREFIPIHEMAKRIQRSELVTSNTIAEAFPFMNKYMEVMKEGLPQTKEQLAKIMVSWANNFLLDSDFMDKWANHYTLEYEQNLPDDISEEDYGLWYQHSVVVDGVRMGYTLDTLKENFK